MMQIALCAERERRFGASGGHPLACRRREGFSLIEVLIALTVMGVGMLGVAVMLTSSMSNMRSSRGSTSANAILQQVVEQAQRQPWSTFSAGQGSWGAPAWFVTTNATACGGTCPAGKVVVTVRQAGGGTAGVEVQQEVYQVNWKSVVGGTAFPQGVPPNVVRVDLRVTWQDLGRTVSRNRTMVTTFYKYNWDQ